MLFALLIMIIVPSISSAISVSRDEFVLSKDNYEKKWTLMFYGDGDWYGGWPLTDFLLQAEVSSTDNVDIIALDDVPDGPAKLWYIDSNSSRILLEEKGEINMGSYETLRDFINYSKTNYPSERYALNIWNHGAAWQGACMDITNVSGNYDIITMDEMQQALRESGGVNIIGFSACVMGCIESAYELRDYTEVYIGSEEMHGMNKEWAELSSILDECSDDSTYNISYKLIDLFETNYPYFGDLKSFLKSVMFSISSNILPYPPACTISAVRTDKLETLVSSVSNFSDILMDNIEFLRKTIKIARLRVDDFPRPMQSYSDMGSQVDLYHFAKLIEKPRFRLLKPEIHRSVEDIKQCLQLSLINEHHQIGHRNSHGLSIYFPPINPQNDYQNYNVLYSNCSLDFSEDTNWDEFLESYLLN